MVWTHFTGKSHFRYPLLFSDFLLQHATAYLKKNILSSLGFPVPTNRRESIFSAPSSNGLPVHCPGIGWPFMAQLRWKYSGDTWGVNEVAASPVQGTGLNSAALRMVAYQIRTGSGSLTFVLDRSNYFLFPCPTSLWKKPPPKVMYEFFVPLKEFPPSKKKVSYKQYIYDIWYMIYNM